MKFSRVVFCDFGEEPRVAERLKTKVLPACTREFYGTITTEDTFVSVLEKFAPEVSASLLPIIFDRQMTLKEGIRQTIGSISSSYYPEIIGRIAHRAIRPRLKEFADFLNNLDVPLVVISGGLIDIVKAVLQEQQLLDRITAIHAAKVDTTGKLLQVSSVFEGDTELVAKVKAMAKYPAVEKITIGDSVRDINMALVADLVFARDRLVGYLDAEKKSYIQWQDFFEIRDRLATNWEVNV
ncbi:haloacid dehalogenase-like hydrolase [Waterburya agarophytonicola K14]|uniref:Haloacid dehalogenase-like hydrolase n=1 Tax=Waterburya agarophytonicola KI4 TaxID=2874699 RepID=A0A964BT41_9CYAN|nr:haloacid dehalogenase-like hydrolase [Waterburya agarophytonicola]MCC0179299.1 haloacid dehalogenase-like hydrolase [Waterburya agarophytonicola KI4]